MYNSISDTFIYCWQYALPHRWVAVWNRQENRLMFYHKDDPNNIQWVSETILIFILLSNLYEKNFFFLFVIVQ